MNILKKAIYIASSPKAERKEEQDLRPAFTFKVEKSSNLSRDNLQEGKYYINGKYSNNFLKNSTKEKSNLNSSKQLSKKSIDRSSQMDIGKKNLLPAKIKILPQKNLQSSKNLILKDLGASNSPLREQRQGTGMTSSKHRVSQESHFFPNEAGFKNSSVAANHVSINQHPNYSRLKIVSRDKQQPVDQRNFKINIQHQKEPIFIKKTADKSPPRNPQRVEFYLKLDKLVANKSRSIEAKKKDPVKHVSIENEKRPNFLSEDKDQTKYLVQERPLKFLSEKPQNPVLLEKSLALQKNSYFQLLKKKFSESEEVGTVAAFVKGAFNDWQPNTPAELFPFKTQVGFYKIKQKIGKGCFGKVYLATQLITGMAVALKVIPKTNMKNKDSRRKIEKEVAILKKVNDHQSIIKLFEVFEDPNFVYLVFEYLENGDLVQYFKRQPLLEEPELRVFFHKILKGIQLLNKNGIIHRDIKLDNILLDKNFHPKVCDFGISSIIEQGKKIYDTGGTPAYLAPEVIKAEGDVSSKSDVWSLGILLYLLNFGIVPFKANDMQVLYNKIIVGTYKIPEQNHTSLDLIDLIRRMLVVDPDKRLAIEDVIRHNWLKGVKEDKLVVNSENQHKAEGVKEGILMYLQYIGFPEGYIKQSMQKGLFNHIKACFDTLQDKFKN